MDEMPQENTATRMQQWARTRRWPFVITYLGVCVASVVVSRFAALDNVYRGIPVVVQVLIGVAYAAVAYGVAELVQRLSNRRRGR